MLTNRDHRLLKKVGKEGNRSGPTHNVFSLDPYKKININLEKLTAEQEIDIVYIYREEESEGDVRREGERNKKRES